MRLKTGGKDSNNGGIEMCLGLQCFGLCEAAADDDAGTTGSAITPNLKATRQ